MATTYVGSRTDTSVGSPWKRLRDAADAGYRLRDFEASRVGEGVVSVDYKGPFVGLALENGKVTDSGRVLNMPYSETELSDVVVRNVHATNVDSFARFKKATDVLIEDCSAVCSPRPLNGFPSGVFTSDHPTARIVCRRVVMRGFAQYPIPSGYWNGDGFADEEQGFDHVYEDCVAEDNADGGWDLKSHRVKVVNCRASRNGRNLRLWGDGEIVDFISEDPRKCHIWLGSSTRLGNYTITRPVFRGGSDKPHLQIDGGREDITITVVDPVVPAGETLRIEKNDSGKLVKVDVVYSSPEPQQPETDLMQEAREQLLVVEEAVARLRTLLG